MVRAGGRKKKASDQVSGDRSQMTGVLSKKKHCGSGFCGRRLDSSLHRPGYLEDQVITRSTHQAGTNVKEAKLRIWLLFHAPDDCVPPVLGTHRVTYI